MEAFVYCWTNTETDKLYIGYHKGSPDDGYVCSSKRMLEDYKKDPSVFSREIIATGTHADMLVFETALLKSVDARNDPQFYNLQNGDGNFKGGGPAKGQFAGKNNPNYGNTVDPATRKLMSINRMGKGRQPKSEETRGKMKTAALNLVSVTCPHCEVSGKPAPMTRWHFDNCRNK